MKKRYISIVASMVLATGVTLFTGCGGGGGGGNSGTSGGGNSGTSSKTLSGTAATGKALSNAAIYLKDSKGTVVSTIADADGKFSFDTTNLTPPFYLKTQGYGLFSFTDQQSGTVNLTSLTRAILAIANNGNPDIYTNSISGLNISDAKTSLKSFMTDDMLQKYGVLDADPMSTSFDADGKGMDALLDSIQISIIDSNKTIEIKNPFTGQIIGTGTFSDGNVSVRDSVDSTEVGSLPESGSVKYTKYFSYSQDDYGSDKDGPRMIDVVEDSTSGKLSVTVTSIDGDTGDLSLIYGRGIKSGNDINYTLPVIMCSDTNYTATTATADFSGTIDSNGDVSGTFINTLLPGDTCEENNSSIYKGTFTADDVTNDQPANVAGTYNGYEKNEGWPVDGPDPVKITQDGSSINVSITSTDSDTGQPFTWTGSGTVYGHYFMFQLPQLITCRDTDPNAQAESAIFFVDANESNGSFRGMVSAGIPAGDSCKAYDYNTTGETISPIGKIWGVKQ